MRLISRRVLLFIVFLLVLGSATIVSSQAIYPLSTNATLTYWMELHPNVALIAKNFGDTEFAKELQKRTGVKLKFIHPAVGQAKEAFNLMLASGELPDIVEYNWLTIPGGPNSAINDGFIVKLNPILSKYAPNLRSFLKKNSKYDRMIKTDEGNYYVFPFFRADLSLLVTSGPMIRKDWLDELGLKVPETIDEWYTVLKTFKEKKGSSTPITVESYTQLSSMLSGGFNSTNSFYVDKGKVKYGGIESARKNYFATMNKWYNEGLIDKNFATASRKIVDSNIMNGKSGAAYGSGGSGIGRYLDSMKGKDTKFDLVAAPFPSAKKGVKPNFSNISQYFGGIGSAAITTKCKNVEAAARLLDYGYSEEGSMFFNFGIEGVTYKMINNYPIYTEYVMKNPEKLSNTQVMSKYMRGSNNGPFVQDKRYIEQYYEYPQQKDALVQWQKTDYMKHMMAPVTPTSDESNQLAKIMNEISTYQDEMTVKFIMGIEPLNDFDKYVAQIKKLGIDKAIAINQAALQRYNSRK